MKTIKKLSILILSFTVILLISNKGYAQTARTSTTVVEASTNVEAVEGSPAPSKINGSSPIAELNELRAALSKAQAYLNNNNLSEQEIANVKASIASTQESIKALLPEEQILLKKQNTNANPK